MHRQVALFLALTVVACRSTEPDPALRDIDAFAARVVRTIPEVPSVAVAVVKNGKRHASAVGHADVERQLAATPKTGYYIASNTKAFTGLVAAILDERGQLDLDAPLATYLPEAAFSADIDAKRLTLRHLLAHTGPLDNGPIVFRTAFSGEHTPELLVRLLGSSKPRGAAFRYDNLGYVVAGLALQRVTGRTWQQLHDELVFRPLGMSGATALMSVAERRPLATPYEVRSSGRAESITYRKNDQMMHAAGGTVMSAEDVARWLEANLTGGRVGGRQAVSATGIAEIQRQQAAVEREHRPFAGTGYGFGWYRGSIGGDAVLFHGGGFEGWRSLFSLMPDRKLGVAVLANSGVANAVNELIISYAYDRLLGKPNVESEHAEKLATMRGELDTQKARVAASAQQRAQRPWQLRHEHSAYVGRYEHPLFGTMTIEERDGKLYASIGAMRSVLEAYTEPETARVELNPGSGEVLRFAFTSGGPRPDALKFRDEVFARK